MKKILITILALIMALVMCFTFVACDGDTDGKPNGPDSSQGTPDGDKDTPNSDGDKKDPDDEGKKDPDESDVGKVSIKLNDALEILDGVLTAKGFTATATYSQSTQKTETQTGSIAIDKRGSKIKIDNEVIVDYETGYVYTNVGDGKYAFKQEFTAGDIDYIKYMITTFVGEGADGEITAHYDEETKTVNLSVNLADNVNKYLDPFYSAYKYSKSLYTLIDDYSVLLLGKKFEEVYNLVEAYLKNPKNTVGTLLDLLEKNIGIDLEALLAEFDIELPEELMAAIKARKLSDAVVGAYNYIMKYVGDYIDGIFGEMTSVDESTDVGDEEGEVGMESLAMGLLNAAIFEEIDPKTIDSTFAEIKDNIPALKAMTVKFVVDSALEKNTELAELYTVIQNGVKFKDISLTVALTVDDNKAVTGVKADLLVAHTYTGEASENYVMLSDNDYLMTAELKINEYKTEVADFDIAFRPGVDYKQPVAQVVYEVSDKGVSVYFETAGNKIEVASYFVETETPDGKVTRLENVPESAFKFDEKTSSFVFGADFVKSVLKNATAGTHLTAFVHFDEDDDTWYGITLVYLNDNIEEVSDYLTDYFMNLIMNGIGGNNMPGDTNVSTQQN